MQVSGLRPVIAHPERYADVESKAGAKAGERGALHCSMYVVGEDGKNRAAAEHAQGRALFAGER